ncbi:MAG: hypothetical protein JSW71_23850 [Gemmatimonadota bacterium]|nr:MAG: hypothetical protein JSW71_23850 [Gemmatimonadota bacterium]
MLASKARLPVVAAAFLALLAAMPANATVPTDPAVALDTAQSTSDAIVEIRNDNPREVEVYAVTEETGRRYLLGYVWPSSTRTLQLPDRLVDADTPFRIKVYSFEHTARSALMDYLEGVKTKVLTAKAGDKISLWLGDPLSQSAIVP